MIHSGNHLKKSNFLSVIGLILLIAFASNCAPVTEEENIHTIAGLKQLFADPPAEFRSAPFWVWNEQISKEGIDFQMKEFKKAGIGGVFVHPRPGLLTEYLSNDWFDLFDYAVQKGKELDMKVWIYDENSYPSGFAGGHVPVEMPDSYKHGAGLKMEILTHLNVTASDTVAVILKKTEAGFADVTASAAQEKGKTGTWYVFRKTYPYKSTWYGGFTYVDLLYKGVTEKFLDLTMSRGYEKKNMADFGKTLPGIFTDEPNLEAALSDGAIMRWTPDLWDAFQQRWGYDLKVNLPSLVEETGKWKKVRHDYYELLLELFIDRWAKPWNKYCEEKDLKWTGHYWEHGWPEPTDGLDEAAFYIWHQMPGVDMLGFRLDTAGLGGQFGNDRAIRELLSAANQAGRNRTLSETYGGGGWEMTFAEQKRLVDWECALGVNFVNLCLSFYSLNGVRKYDYPLSFTYHQPWWENYRLMGDYIGRVSLAMSAGEQINKTLVLQPNTSAWMYFSRKDKNPYINTIRNGFKNFVYRLEQHQLEYDLGSENVLKELGSVKGKNLRVGRRDYSLVVIPAGIENINRSTYELLKKYLDNGGKILAFRNQVPLLDGEPSPLMAELIAKSGEKWIVAEDLDDVKVLHLLANDDFAINDLTRNGMLYHQRRVLDDGQVLFVVNSHQTKKSSAAVTALGKYVSKLDLVTGKMNRYPAKVENGKVSFRIDLETAGSALFTVTSQKYDEPGYPADSGEGVKIESTGPMIVKRESDNILVVNYLDLKTAKSDKKDIYYMDAMISLFKENGVAIGDPWQHKIQYKKNYLDLDTLFKDGSGFEASYHFNINNSLNTGDMKSIRAVVERPDLWTVSINGNEVPKTAGSYWIDKDFAAFAVGQYLKPGKNTLTLKAPRMHILAELMPVYFLGDFLVKPAGTGFDITGGDISSLGSWREAGLPFYSQKVAYSQWFMVNKTEGSCFKVKLKQWNGTVAGVLVNGKPAGLIAWQPNELDITSLLKDGDNSVSVQVTGSLKNTFGVFYNKNDDWIIGPHSWIYAPAKEPSAAGYFLMDYGLFEPFDLLKIK
ncbi:MAG: glycosyl hydrolase [Bacteroidia bacterium]|nr:glycosyl hydrolase [Bacteroidia bacterium]